MSINRIFFLTALVCLVVAATLSAQDFRATISGVVTDPSGAAVPGANVKVTRLDTNETKEVKTTENGTYSIPYLNPGVYNVEVSAPGFQTLRREQIVLRVADKLDLSLRLKVGAVTETVTVTAEQEVIETASADRGLVFDPIKTQEYPLNGRQTYMLLSLTPGVVFTQEQFGASGFSGTRGWDVNANYKINGARTGQSMFLLNGAPITDPTSGNWQLAPNVEAVEEFKVMTNTYDAGYGRFGGGVVNTTLKSGGNNWHGTLFEYWRNRIFDANSFQNNFAGTPKGFHNQHQFGASVGGPVRKNKDFIFGSFEGWQEVVPFPALSTTVPTELRDGQHFTQFGYKIYDPLTTHPCTAARDGNCQGQQFAHDPFPNNVIPSARISPVGAKILSYFPAPNVAGISNNYVAAQNLGRYYYEQPIVRWDHVFDTNNKLYGVYTGQQGHEYRSVTGFPRPAATGNTNNERTDQNAIINFTRVMSSTTVLDVRLSFGRFVQTTPGYSDFSLSAKDLGMTQFTPAPTSPGAVAPAITVGGYSNPILSGTTAFSWTATNTWNLTPSISKTISKHNLRAGVELNYTMRGSVNTGASNGSFTFNQDWTRQLPGRSGGTFDGSGVATLLLGYPTSGSISYNDTQYRTRPYYGLYLQDDWKLTPRLTLNLGLRYDIQVPWIERYNRTNRGFDFTVKNPLSDQIIAAWTAAKATYDRANPTARYPYPAPPAAIYGSFLFPGIGGRPERLYNTDWTNFGPRIGVAYRIGDKTVIRAGAGVYYIQPTQQGTTTGFSQTTDYVTSLDGGINSGTPSAGANLSGPYSLVNPFPNGFLSPTGAKAGALTGNSTGGISFDPPDFKIPRTYQYSFGIQRELPGRIAAEISYAGNYQTFINFAYDTNAQGLTNQLQAIADPSFYTRTVPNPFLGIVPANLTLGAGATIQASNLLRPFPIFNGGVTNNLLQQGKYRSDQLQVKIEKRVLGGGSAGVMTWVLSYAFGKAFEQNHRLNTWNLAEKPIKELDNTDKAQNLSFSGVWDLPFGASRKFVNTSPVGKAILGDWRFTWVLSYASGNPTNWPGGPAVNNPNYLNTCGNYHATKQDENHWFNNDKTCYVQLPSNSLATLPDRMPDIRNPSVGPFLNSALERTIRITERYSLQIRGEAFNLTNSVQRSGPSANVTSTTFGQLDKAQLNFPRAFQMAARFMF